MVRGQQVQSGGNMKAVHVASRLRRQGFTHLPCYKRARSRHGQEIRQSRSFNLVPKLASANELWLTVAQQWVDHIVESDCYTGGSIHRAAIIHISSDNHLTPEGRHY